MRWMTTACLVLGVTAFAVAEDIVLVDGRYLQVKILGNPTDRGMKVKVLDTGGELFIPWSLVCEADRARLHKIYIGGESNEAIMEEGVRLTMKSGDTYEGRIEKETDAEVSLKSGGKLVPIKKDMIREREVLPVNVVDSYGPDEYFAKITAEQAVADDDAVGNLERSKVAETLGLYEKAIELLGKVKAADPEYQAAYVKNRGDALEVLAKNKQIRVMLDDARRSARYNNFKKAFDTLEQVASAPSLPDSLKAEVEVCRKKFTDMRYEYFRAQVALQFENALKNKIREKARDPKLKCDEARKWLRADCFKEVATVVGNTLGLDPKSEVDKMWGDRGWKQPRFAMYGRGSFIILGKAPDAAKIEAAANQALAAAVQGAKKSQSSKQGSQNSFSDPSLTLPKPPTKDEWWDKIANSYQKEQWMLAFWAENSKKVDVKGEKWEECDRCGGKGAISIGGTQGDDLKAVCPDCQGHKRFRGVNYQ